MKTRRNSGPRHTPGGLSDAPLVAGAAACKAGEGETGNASSIGGWGGAKHRLGLLHSPALLVLLCPITEIPQLGGGGLHSRHLGSLGGSVG